MAAPVEAQCFNLCLYSGEPVVRGFWGAISPISITATFCLLNECLVGPVSRPRQFLYVGFIHRGQGVVEVFRVSLPPEREEEIVRHGGAG